MSGRGCRVKGGVCSMPPWNARKWLIHAAIPARMANTEIGESIMSLRSVKTLVAYEIADDPVARFYRAIPSRVLILRNGDLHSQAFAYASLPRRPGKARGCWILRVKSF